MFLLSAALALAMQTARAPVVLDMTGGWDYCWLSLDGVGLDEKAFEQRARGWAKARRIVLIRPTRDTPYRCAGATIFRLQRAGIQIGFLQGPDEVSVYLPPGPCRVAVNGVFVPFARFRWMSRGWTRTQPEVHFLPDPHASFRCVERVLGALKAAGVTKMGFVGNETEAAPNDAQPPLP